MGNCASAAAEDCEDSVELRVKKLLQPGGKWGKRKSRTSIRLSSFAEHARRLLQTKEGEEELDKQLERLNLIGSNCERLIFSVECGQSLRNALKNRYTNVLPYDSNRVRLSVPDRPGRPGAAARAAADDDPDDAIDDDADSDEADEGSGGGCSDDPLMRLTRAPSDYINASPVRLANRQFIACQGPLPETLGQHWQMIWEAGARLVAMVTDCVEQGRNACAKYWPDQIGGRVCFGQFAVVMETEESLDNGRLVRRELAVSVTTGRGVETRRLRHLQYLGLPLGADWSTIDPANFCSFADEVGSSARADWPTVVHCDSGVGRTGVLLCLLSFGVDSVRASQQVDVPAAVIGLRLSRPGMVHSRNQLAFVYKCLLYNLIKESLISEASTDALEMKSAEEAGVGENGTEDVDYEDMSAVIVSQCRLNAIG